MSGQDLAGEDGFTLIEVLLALIIVSVAVVAFVTGLAAAIQQSDDHRKDATLRTILANEIDALQAAPCAGGVLTPSYTAPGGYSFSATPLTCPTVGTPTLVTVTASSSDGRASITEKIYVRKTS